MRRFNLVQRTKLSSFLLLSFLAAGCSDNGTDSGMDAGGAAADDPMAAGATSGGSGNTLSGSLEVVTFWGDDDAKAIENATEAFTRANPDVTVELTSVENGWVGLTDNIDGRLAKAVPLPGVFQKGSDDSLMGWNADDVVQDLTALYTEPEPEEQGGNAWQDVIPESILKKAQFDGKYLTVNANMHRTNAIFYNKKLFAEHDLEPPTTIDEFKELLVKLKTEVDLEGGSPLLIGNIYSWTLHQFIFTCLAPHVMGPDEFTNYFGGNMDPENAKFEELLNLGLFLRCGSDPETECDGYLNADMDELDHYPSIEAFVASYEDGMPKYAMAPAGDWVKQWMKNGGLEPGVDFDQFVCPVANAGDTPVFTGGTDSFSMAAESPSHATALAFMKFLGSKEGQLAINEKKGAIPLRNDIDLADYPDVFDAVQVKTYADFQAHTYFVPDWKPGALSGMGEQLKLSLQGGTIEVAYNYVKNNYETLK